ncbi:peptidylprolyl isomerase [Angomonas deanei]|nr:peptidylprolyl isomerase [Angomonas deanei]|eukprot:EPY30825.1 peptidylprolyl isomerase [Angomonas deanei]
MNAEELKAVFSAKAPVTLTTHPTKEEDDEPRATAEQLLSFRNEALYPAPPSKIIIYDHSLSKLFNKSYAFTKLLTYVQAVAESVEGVGNHQELFFNLLTDDDGSALHLQDEGVTAVLHPVVQFFQLKWFPFLLSLKESIPLEDLAQQRFGNRAKRTWHAKMEEALPSYMNELATLIKEHGTETSDSTVEELAAELAEYMKDCYGNCVRLDYGTGHELHFFIIIMICLQELGDTGGYLIHDDITSRNVVVPTSEPLPNAIAANEEITVKTTSKRVNKCKFLSQLRKQFCHFVFFQYIHFMRVLQKHYSLEPAGSHGVWGLDDYHHLPYILGASQLVGPTQTLQTKDICDKEKVYQNASNYYYFEMIEWILETKRVHFMSIATCSTTSVVCHGGRRLTPG